MPYICIKDRQMNQYDSSSKTAIIIALSIAVSDEKHYFGVYFLHSGQLSIGWTNGLHGTFKEVRGRRRS